jgi:hypothetical protein
MSPNEREYYRNRAKIERRLANAATNPHAAEIHTKLASLYEGLVQLEEAHPPAGLSVVR